MINSKKIKKIILWYNISEGILANCGDLYRLYVVKISCGSPTPTLTESRF